MAIKIISRRDPPEKRPFRVTCTHCKSVMEFYEADAQRYSDVREGTYWQINCPVCSRRLSASESNRIKESAGYIGPDSYDWFG